MIDPISASIPTIGQRQTAAKAMVAQGLQQLAMQIYVQLAGKYIVDLDTELPVDNGHLHQLARESLQAAQCYFSGLGIAQFPVENHNG